MRTETYQLPGESHSDYIERQRKLRRRREDASASLSSFSSTDDSITLIGTDLSSSFDSGSRSDFTGGGGDFGGGGSSSDF